MHITQLTSHEAAAVFAIDPGRQAYLLCVEGHVSLTQGDGQAHLMHRHDGAELKGPLEVRPRAETDGALLLLLEMKITTDTRGDF